MCCPPDPGGSCAVERLADLLRRAAREGAPAGIALMRLLAEADDPAGAEAALAAASRREPGGSEAARVRKVHALWRANPDAWRTVRRVLDGVEHGGEAADPADGVAHWAAVFDRAARVSPEASVALYSLGSPDLLRDATAEVVARMRDWGLLGPDRVVLDIGSGIGRFEAALSGEVAAITGIDIAAAMIEEARRRCAGLANVDFVPSSGRDLSPFADAGFDLVMAVDAFPYLVQSGRALVETHLREAARVLRPGGDLLVLNFSYRGDLDADRRDAAELGPSVGFAILRDGSRDFTLWDGATFHLRKVL